MYSKLHLDLQNYKIICEGKTIKFPFQRIRYVILVSVKEGTETPRRQGTSRLSRITKIDIKLHFDLTK